MNEQGLYTNNVVLRAPRTQYIFATSPAGKKFHPTSKSNLLTAIRFALPALGDLYEKDARKGVSIVLCGYASSTNGYEPCHRRGGVLFGPKCSE